MVHYTDLAGDTRRLACSASRRTPTSPIPASELSILAVDQPFTNHNGGQVLFGPDGYLYRDAGRRRLGRRSGRPGPIPCRPAGIILRIGRWSGGGYAVPPDNPFVGHAERPPRDLELRAAESLAVDLDPVTGDLYIADVGQGTWEEVGVSTAAARGRRAARLADHGRTGVLAHRSPATRADSQLTGACPTITGRAARSAAAIVYRGAAIPALQGHYFYADYCAGWVRSFRLQDGHAVEPFQWPTLAPGGPVPSFGQDAAGELYILA